MLAVGTRAERSHRACSARRAGWRAPPHGRRRPPRRSSGTSRSLRTGQRLVDRVVVVGQHPVGRLDLHVVMPAPSSIACAAWAPVSPRSVRTFEYLLNADLVRKLAQRERAKAGAMNTKYIGSKWSMVSIFLSGTLQQANSISYFPSVRPGSCGPSAPRGEPSAPWGRPSAPWGKVSAPWGKSSAPRALGLFEIGRFGPLILR